MIAHIQGELAHRGDGFVVVEMTPLGYPAEEARAPQRKELTEVVFYDSWGKTSNQTC